MGFALEARCVLSDGTNARGGAETDCAAEAEGRCGGIDGVDIVEAIIRVERSVAGGGTASFTVIIAAHAGDGVASEGGTEPNNGEGNGGGFTELDELAVGSTGAIVGVLSIVCVTSTIVGVVSVAAFTPITGVLVVKSVMGIVVTPVTG